MDQQRLFRVVPMPGIAMSSADLDDSDIQAVVAVLRSGRLALGSKAVAFEQRLADYLGVRHAVAVSSGTAALHLAVRALGLGAGDEVLVPSFTFAASVNAFLFEGAVPVFVDIDPDTFNLDVRDLEAKVTSRTRAVMAVDVFGHPADWDEILRVCTRHNLRVIDDSCEALGAEYKGQKIGQFGNVAAFAFYPNKQITTGEGGMLVTNDDEVAQSAASLRNQGRGKMGAWLEHEELGYNYRLDEMSAALGLSQLERLEGFLAKREAVARLYTDRLAAYEWARPPVVRPYVRMSWFVYVVLLAEGVDRNAVMARLAEKGIPTRAYFCPIHQQAYLRDRFPGPPGGLPVTEALARRALALPFHNNLTEADVSTVVGALGTAVADLLLQ